MPARVAPEVRFAAKVTPGVGAPPHAPHLGPCLVWTAAVNGGGYGIFRVDADARVYAHHWWYEQAVGPIPAGLVPDHLCHDPATCAGGPGCPHRRCVNVAHLELVTRAVNTLRGCAVPAANARKRRCLRDHPLRGANLYVHPRRGTRHCRACQRARWEAWRARRPAA